MGTLYVVGTPIGNLEDVTLRALRVLREVELVAAEDTRTTRKLLTHYQIATPLTSFHDFSGPGKTRSLLQRLGRADVALVSEAGTPAIADPGFPLIRAAIAAGIQVVPIPGASAVVAALGVSGLPAHAFHFLGFLPRKPGPRRSVLESVAHEANALVLYEAPHRLVACLRDLLDVLGDRHVAIAREMTKVFEEVLRVRLSEALEVFQSRAPRGEFTLVIEGRQGREADEG